MIQINDEKAMKNFGRKVGSLVRGGDVLELVGDVGAGKTTFVKGFAVGMGIDEDVQSPSFTISRSYAAPGGLLLSHYDFYRLQDPGIMAVELQEIITLNDTVTVIEWADIVQDVLPNDRLTLRILADGEKSRQLVLMATGERSKLLMEALHEPVY
jgi:tRNA threonylcarbamoyladenosine biosynthesis protein TsaE